jgi:hypothetical protein
MTCKTLSTLLILAIFTTVPAQAADIYLVRHAEM